MANGLRKRLTSYGDAGFSLFLRKAFIKAMGFSDDALDRPIIGITDTFSDFNPCHGNVPDLIAAIRRGVMLAGGLPMAFPTISIHESFAHPTSMFLRNLMALDTEEMIRAQPMDAVVLVGGCDKTLPAQLMGAASADVPAIVVPTGPMLVGHHRGEVLGACTDCRRLWARHRAGEIDATEIEAVSGRLAPTKGTCMVMGTASTVACMVEALGMCLPGGGTCPATHAERLRLAEASGTAAVRLAAEGLRPRDILTPAALRNAFTVLQAIGGSTNAVIHFTAIAGRLGILVDLDAFDALGRAAPVLVDLKPSGAHYMEHFHWAGGVPRLLRELAPFLDTSCRTVAGGTIADVIAAAEDVPGQNVIRGRDAPIMTGGGLAVLRGNLAPQGALLKRSAATPALLRHEGRAVVFESVEDMIARGDDPALQITPDDVIVMRNAGPKGAPGMPEAGYVPIPRKLAQAGVKDMVRISDARMSGTAFGTVVLHVTPEAATGGPLALVQGGDRIRLDADARRLDLLVDEADLARRRAAWSPPPPPPGAERGYLRLYLDQVLQADEGCDFAFCRPPA
ncbi:putative dehydratase IlvD1 [Rhodovastum atsumiense]|uniref:Dihydroxy-acid dehydratase n=1 Tax=Rhodovastum atsumiense TaxID=504468 RepID=A0A5M6IU63_9PROT|nr:IlvD/Edd family dehydratase [Rhodovastum atsumiense]KAA5611078.1 dihydroxy-acid dehydratase [Rhodovastum atsumiense]CAH2599137.1 putative dehydratase IlvD1 [Rhodovastum atsumiense]